VSGYPDDPRGEALAAHLAALPDFLRRCAGLLGDRIVAGARLRCVEQAAARSAHIRETAAEAARRLPESRAAALAALAGSAAAACEDFRAALAALRPVAGVLGPERLAGQLVAVEGIVDPVADLLDEVHAEVAEVGAALDAAGAAVGAGSRAHAYAMLAGRMEPVPVRDAVEAAIQRVVAFWRERDVVPLAVDTPLEVAVAPSNAITAEIAFDVGAPYTANRAPYVLRVPDLSDLSGPGGGERARLRREYLNDPMLEVIAVHDTFVGHYEAALRGPSALRTCVRWSAGFPEGWSHYAEEPAVEQGLAGDRPLVRVAQLNAALECAVRCLVYLAIHVGQWSFMQAAEQAASSCLWPPDRALREVVMTTSSLSSAMYTLGKCASGSGGGCCARMPRRADYVTSMSGSWTAGTRRCPPFGSTNVTSSRGRRRRADVARRESVRPGRHRPP